MSSLPGLAGEPGHRRPQAQRLVHHPVDVPELGDLLEVGMGAVAPDEVDLRLRPAHRRGIGWLAFVIATCLDWLDERTITRDQLRDLCTRAGLGAFGVSGDAVVTGPGSRAENSPGAEAP